MSGQDKQASSLTKKTTQKIAKKTSVKKVTDFSAVSNNVVSTPEPISNNVVSTSAPVSNNVVSTSEPASTDKPLSFKQKRSLRKQKRKEKSQEKDLKRYGLKVGDVKDPLSKMKKTKQGTKALERCWVYFKNYKVLIVLISILALLAAGLAMLDPIFTERMVTFIGESNAVEAIKYSAMVCGSLVLYSVVDGLWNIMAHKISQKVVKNLRTDLIDNISRTKTSKFDSINSGEIISRINTDTAVITDVIFGIIGNLSYVLSGLAFTVYICFINIWLGLLLIVAVIVFSIFENGFQKHNYRMNKKRKAISDRNIGLISEIARGIRDIKNLNIRKNAQGKFTLNAQHLENVGYDKAKGNILWRKARRISEMLFEFGLVVLGVTLMMQGSITIGALIIIIFYRYHSMNLIQYLADIREKINDAKVSAERICEILDEKDYPKESFGKKVIKEPKGAIEFKNVEFSYNDKTEVFKNLNLKIEPNKSVAFVGKSGQGKSTLLSLLSRLYDVNKGKILIDNVNIKDLSEDGLRDLVTVVPQTPYIFNTSIRENLTFIAPDLTDEQMFEVCKKAQIHDFIINKEKGYDSLIGENGLILSGGQRQRLAIARALLKNSRIILFDEATSALDNENQKKIQDVISNLTTDHTVLVVAHRLSTVVNCDEIVMLDEGKIIAKGTHKELMKTCAPYKALYKIEQEATKLEGENNC